VVERVFNTGMDGGGIAGIGVFTALLLVTSFVAVFIRFVQTLL